MYLKQISHWRPYLSYCSETVEFYNMNIRLAPIGYDDIGSAGRILHGYFGLFISWSDRQTNIEIAQW